VTQEHNFRIIGKAPKGKNLEHNKLKPNACAFAKFSYNLASYRGLLLHCSGEGLGYCCFYITVYYGVDDKPYL